MYAYTQTFLNIVLNKYYEDFIVLLSDFPQMPTIKSLMYLQGLNQWQFFQGLCSQWLWNGVVN